jgi:hypothetical protein
MKKMKKFNLSQAAHRRLAQKHKKSSSFSSRIKSDYHSTVLNCQEKENRIFSKEERKRVFRACNSIFLKQYG